MPIPPHTITLSATGTLSIEPSGVTGTPSLAHTGLPSRLAVCGGIGIQGTVTGELVKWLRSQARYSKRLGGICTGSWVLARAGLLDGYECSVHWEWLAAMQEAFPRVQLSTSLFTLDRDRLTSSGGTAPLDMMLHLIGRDHGHELSAAISDMFVYERIRNEQDHQRVPLKHMLGTQQPKLQDIVALMEANLEEPINLDELAAYVALSRRQLERMFQKYLHCSPSRYYLRLRLIRARQLLKQTPISIVELAVLCGFVSTPHFSKCYREYFGVPPSDERSATDSERSIVVKPIIHSAPAPMPINVLEQARGESTFASIKNLRSGGRAD